MAKHLTCAAGHLRKEFTPQAHQLRVMNEFLTSRKRGILFYHALGSGKTCAAYMAIDAYIEKYGKNMPVYIFSPAALATSHRDQYCDFCGAHPENFSSQFKFFSYNDRAGITKKIPKNMDNSIILIDEVQEIINGKANNSATLVAVYDAVLNASNVKVILLSGTPIFREYGLSLILNLLDPGCITMDEEEFLRIVKDNKGILYSAIKGLISYVPVPSPELYPTRVQPDITYTLQMSEHQFNKYKDVRLEEIAKVRHNEEKIKQAKARGNMALYRKLKASQFIQTTKLLSRRLCNFAYPDGIPAVKDMGASWILNDPDLTHVANLKIYSPKMAKLVHNVLTLPGKHMVYGWFKSSYGLHLIYTYLYNCGLEPLIFSGDSGNAEERAKTINYFNADNNIRGEKHKVILVSGAGSVGISLLAIHHLHVFEASINEFTTLQAEGRAFRTMSHHQLPENERNCQVYRYFTSLPPQIEFKEAKSSEEMIYEKGMKNMKATEEILDIMKRGAFDCKEPYNSAITNCYDYYDEIDLAPVGDFDFDINPYGDDEVIEGVEEE